MIGMVTIMLGYYQLTEEQIHILPEESRNMEENLYHLCYPLVVNEKKDLPVDIRDLYEMLDIPILSFIEFSHTKNVRNLELEEYLEKFSQYLELNVNIELQEENRLGHLLRVGHYAKELATSLNLSKQEIKDIYIAAIFHDIGKCLVPKGILDKKGKLTNEEFEIVKKHCDDALKVLDGFLSEPSLSMIRFHHERCNGSGYPKGIIPNLGDKILGIVDSYDTMISDRVYQKAMTKEEAFTELRNCTKAIEDGGKGILYDQNLVEQFIQLQM